MTLPQRLHYWIALIVLLVVILCVAWRNFSQEANLAKQGESTGSLESRIGKVGAELPRKDRLREFTSLERWKSSVETEMGQHEARRSRIIARKQTVDSEIYLLAVEPPSVSEAVAVRKRLDRLLAAAPNVDGTAVAETFERLLQDYDPYGEQGSRVIQIDVPDEPNGRLTGFTCDAPDIGEMARRFRDGEMTDLANLRGYSADYAGMPLKRFDALLVEE